MLLLQFPDFCNSQRSRDRHQHVESIPNFTSEDSRFTDTSTYMSIVRCDRASSPQSRLSGAVTSSTPASLSQHEDLDATAVTVLENDTEHLHLVIPTLH
jgi:hypothetical protein